MATSSTLVRDMTIFSNLLRQARRAEGLNISAAAAAVGITPTSWSRYEAGDVPQPKRAVVVRIAERFNLPLNTVLEAAGWPAVADAEQEARQHVMAEVQSALAAMTLDRLRSVPALLRIVADLP